MRQNSELRRFSRTALTGNWTNAVIITFIYYAIMIGVSSFGTTPKLAFLNVAELLLLPLVYGIYVTFLNLTRGEKLEISMLFDGFKDYVRIMLTILLMVVYTFLWTLLLIVPGIIKMYSYILTPYILRDEPELRYNETIEKSMAMMHGHKMRLFLLHLSFIGWFILSLITCGIGFLFLVPYMATAQAAFYQDLKTEYDKKAQPVIE